MLQVRQGRRGSRHRAAHRAPQTGAAATAASACCPAPPCCALSARATAAALASDAVSHRSALSTLRDSPWMSAETVWAAPSSRHQGSSASGSGAEGREKRGES